MGASAATCRSTRRPAIRCASSTRPIRPRAAPGFYRDAVSAHARKPVGLSAALREATAPFLSDGPVLFLKRPLRARARDSPEAVARGVLSHQLGRQCPQAVLQTPLLHQQQRVRGRKLRIEGEQAGAGASTPLAVRLDELGALLVPSGAKRAGHIECGLCHTLNFRCTVAPR